MAVWLAVVPVANEIIKGVFSLLQDKITIQNLQNQVNETHQKMAEEIQKSQQVNDEIRNDYNSKIQQYQAQLDKVITEYSHKLNEEIENREKSNTQHEIELQKHAEEYKNKITILSKESLLTRIAELKSIENELFTSLRTVKAKVNELEKSFNEQKQQYEEEYSHIVKFEHERNDENRLNILLLGITGHGKSTFGNRLCSDNSREGNNGPFAVSDGTRSKTKLPKKGTSRIGGKDISVIDTPGTFDSDNEDRYHMNNLIEYLRGINGINAFIIVKSMGEPRFDSGYQNMIKDLQRYLGESFWENVILVITKVDTIAPHKFLQWKLDFRGEVISKFNLANKPNINLPVIGICSLGNYEQSLTDLICKHVSKLRRYKCTALHSPIDLLKKNMEIAGQGYKIAKLDFKAVQNKITDVQKKMNITIERLKALNEPVDKTLYPSNINEERINQPNNYGYNQFNVNRHNNDYLNNIDDNFRARNENIRHNYDLGSRNNNNNNNNEINNDNKDEAFQAATMMSLLDINSTANRNYNYQILNKDDNHNNNNNESQSNTQDDVDKELQETLIISYHDTDNIENENYEHQFRNADDNNNNNNYNNSRIDNNDNETCQSDIMRSSNNIDTIYNENYYQFINDDVNNDNNNNSTKRQWSCPSCTYLNDESTNICGMCNNVLLSDTH